MSSWTLQDPPRPPAASHSVSAEFAERSSRFSWPFAKKPMAWPVGAQNGNVPSSVPGSTSGTSVSRRRIQSCRRPSGSTAANTTLRPSGETAGGPPKSPVSWKSMCSGGGSRARTAASGAIEPR